MTHNKKHQGLDHLKRQALKRWGVNALRSLKSLQPASRVSTGFADLDQALGTGGISRGKAVELIGKPTSGIATLGLTLLANIQKMHENVVVIDCNHTFDPIYAHQCGLKTEGLLLIQPPELTTAFDITLDLLNSHAVGGILIDKLIWREKPSASMFHRQTISLAKSSTILIFLTALERGYISSVTSGKVPIASISLHVVRQGWVHQASDVRGYQVQVSILKNKLAPISQPVLLTINHDSRPDGDGK